MEILYRRHITFIIQNRDFHKKNYTHHKTNKFIRFDFESEIK